MPNDGVVIYIHNPVEDIVIGAKNPGKNIWNKVEKSSKIGQDYKNLVSDFAVFMNAIVKI